MIVFPTAKINLGLQILGKRTDGYHNLNTVFYPIPLFDALEIVQDDTNHSGINFSVFGNNTAVDIHTNLCTKAYHLLKNDYPSLPAVYAALIKAIPAGAGLGGGSADGAFTLSLLNQKFALGISKEKLQQYALTLGSDCPFFIDATPAIAGGRGEELEPIELSLKDYSILLVNPKIHIPTPWAFSRITNFSPKIDFHTIINKNPAEWQNLVVNDFEQPVFNTYPEIATIKDSLYKAGALYASLSGTGSTVFGIFSQSAHPKLSFPSNYFLKWL